MPAIISSTSSSESNMLTSSPNLTFLGSAMRNTTLLAVLLTFAPNLHAQGDTWAGAKWVWDQPNADKVPQSDVPRFLRCNFELTAKPRAAELWITADNHYTVWVNGEKVGEDGEWQSIE